MNTLVIATIAFAIGLIVGRYRSAYYSNRGEFLVNQAIRAKLNSPDYHLFNHITVQFGDGTTEIDHILVSRFGIFVIETKNYKGWIFANENHREWTQVIFRKKFRFQNPIHQNSCHLRAIQELLDFLPSNCVASCVVFTGDAEFKTSIPVGVFSLNTLIDYLQDQTQEVMSTNRMHFCVGRIEAMRLAISGKTDLEHIQNLRWRHGDAG